MTAEEVGDEDFGEYLAQSACVLHCAYFHPAEFLASTGRDVEEALAAYETELGPFFFYVVKTMATFTEDKWKEKTG